ncbi:hypothetical protein EVAR_20330_1 [Eumeta japonica]|uniref:Uncharacterized protein n=1 Tax=Eumeta variegata TaxID=151549 RepID=A0A4C1VUM5_EUMVA|nr:hypothetical protein EVAR_20330_1 [Eumeta japonica]
MQVASLVPGATTWSRSPHSYGAEEAADNVKPSCDGPELPRYRSPGLAPVGDGSQLYGHFTLRKRPESTPDNLTAHWLAPT